MRYLTLSGKITIFKSLAISKIVYITYMSYVPSDVISHLEMVHKKIVWNGKRPKIKHTSLIGDFSKGGLKDVDITSKFTALHLCWLKRLYDDNFHPWKLIPTFLFKKLFKCSSPMFYPNLDPNTSILDTLPIFYKNIVNKWVSFSKSEPITASSVLSESIWYNRHIKIDSRSIQPTFFNIKENLFVHNLVNENGEFLSWVSFREKYHLNQVMFFKWLQLKSSIPARWLKIVKESVGFNNLCHFSPHINYNARILLLEKLSSRHIYNILIKTLFKTPTAQLLFDNKFDVPDWKKIYLLPRDVTVDAYTRIFQYKILNNILFLNKKLFLFGIVDSPLCSLCNLENETPIHLFSECHVSKALWADLTFFLQGHVHLEVLTPQNALLGFTDDSAIHHIVNHILLIFKIFLYKYRSKNPTFMLLLSKIKNVIEVEKRLCFSDRRRIKFHSKWSKILDII